jgi:hypothetical protein
MIYRNTLIALGFILTALAMGEEEAEEVEMRNLRNWGVSGEIGMNSLSSLAGVFGTYYFTPNIALDVGAGLSSNGLRPGLRGRYLFSQERLSYFIGFGYKYGLGSEDEWVELEDPETKDKFEVLVESASFLDFSVGTDFMANNGFMLIFNIGYSFALSDKFYTVESGYSLSDKSAKAFDFVFGSGPMLALSVGKAF